MDGSLCGLDDPFIIITDSNKRLWPYRHITEDCFVLHILISFNFKLNVSPSVRGTVLVLIFLCVKIYHNCVSLAMKHSHKSEKDISN